ncbi:MAG: Grx4 family monothiol glutaredoxin [Candidatus Omnitrophica bacterium]|nr:Grx4 family monothiol glutaredoxin [Candidatus Omnitrophota bacterium]
MTSNPAVERIEKEIRSHRVVVFVKGTPEAPQCGFSAATMELFKKMNVPFHAVDVLSNPEFRTVLPQFSKWPTFPQVFIDGKLIGGCDIAHEMYESGALQKLLHIP